ncbi:MAG TPA: zinc ABC transporter substrate-binding protein [Pseudonocardiaceae bacterium]|jgi:zinc/manganese transport system substrate-binding protein|nr:zinc ABC transporter substrate-binding protein [Pseudonocardiaceae bacterium]
MAIRIRWRATQVISTVAATVLLGVAGCGSADQQASGNDRLTVVASTDVWGSVARTVAGDAADVEPIIDDPSADPHSYESTPTDAAEVTNADLVVFNGGGYDEFMSQILHEAGNKPTVEAFALQQATPADDSEPNEHVWYDLAVAQGVAQQIAEKLGQLAPAQAQQLAAQAQTFRTEIDGLAGRLSSIAASHGGQRVAMTEPLAQYLITAAGLVDATPPEFLEAVEEETDPPAAAFAATQELFTQRQVQVLIYNPQAETPVTSQIRAAAEAAGIPVVTMTETLPENTDYRGWMSAQIDALSTALQGPT